jgi:WhiB family transcriptional regulator, redox-sensing transcriptional regulator
MPWEESAVCGRYDPEIFFGATSNDERRAKAICATCPVRLECLASALSARVEFGVWGGLNERERRTLLRRHPGTRDWRRALEDMKPVKVSLRG